MPQYYKTLESCQRNSGAFLKKKKKKGKPALNVKSLLLILAEQAVRQKSFTSLYCQFNMVSQTNSH